MQGRAEVDVTNSSAAAASCELVATGPFFVTDRRVATHQFALAVGQTATVPVHFVGQFNDPPPALGTLCLSAPGLTCEAQLQASWAVPRLAVHPPNVDVGSVAVHASKHQVVDLRNTGLASAVWTAASSDPHVSVVPAEGQLSGATAAHPVSRQSLQVIVRPTTATELAASVSISVAGRVVDTFHVRATGTYDERDQLM